MLKLAHKNLDVWKLGKELVAETYRITENFPKIETFGITNQLRRASVSIVSNIAEGSSRSSSAERKRFYIIARSSLVEVETQFEIAQMLNFVSEKEIESLSVKINSLFAMLTNLIKKTL